MKYNEIHRKLKKAGCYQIGSNRHPKWYSPITGKEFVTSHHDSEEAAIGTLKNIEKLSGVRF